MWDEAEEGGAGLAQIFLGPEVYYINIYSVPWDSEDAGGIGGGGVGGAKEREKLPLEIVVPTQD